MKNKIWQTLLVMLAVMAFAWTICWAGGYFVFPIGAPATGQYSLSYALGAQEADTTTLVDSLNIFDAMPSSPYWPPSLIDTLYFNFVGDSMVDSITKIYFYRSWHARNASAWKLFDSLVLPQVAGTLDTTKQWPVNDLAEYIKTVFIHQAKNAGDTNTYYPWMNFIGIDDD